MPNRLRFEWSAPLVMALCAQALFGAAFIARSAFTIHGQRYFSLFDDAMISMRYARNFTKGFGLVWNPGEVPVEGYSNFLWTSWMAALHTVAPEATVSLLVMLTGLACLMANVVVTWAIARAVAPDRPVVWAVATMAVAVCYPLDYWTLRGMEVGLAVLCVDGAVLAAIAPERLGPWQTPILATCLLALPLIRDDGMVPAAIVGAYQLVGARRSGHTRRGWIVFAAPFVAGGAHELFRHAYYGEWVPNTYLLKVSGVPLPARLGRGLTVFGAVVLRNLWALLLLASLARPVARRRLLLTLVAAAMCLYSISVGGDAWEWFEYPNRYLTTVLPLMIVLAACGIDTLARSLSARERWALAALSAAAALALAYHTDPERALLRSIFYVAAGVGCVALRLVMGRANGDGARPSAFTMATVFLAALLVGTVSGPGTFDWIRHRGQHVDDDATMTKLGIALRTRVDPRTTIATAWAGAVPYFSDLQTVDLLGKNDRYIARLPSREPFIPGHNKWDYSYSLGQRRPDIIVPPLWQPTPEDRDYIAAQGYVEGPAGVYVRRGSALVHADTLAALGSDLQ